MSALQISASQARPPEKFAHSSALLFTGDAFCVPAKPLDV